MEDNTNSQTSIATDVKNDENVAKTFSQDEVNAIVSKRLAEEKEKAKTNLDEAIKNAIAEEKRQAKLTADERAREEKEKQEKALSEREASITLRERQIEAREMLVEKGLSTDLTALVVDADKEIMANKIEKLEKAYNDSVASGVEDKLKGVAPKDFSSQKNDVPKQNIFGAF